AAIQQWYGEYSLPAEPYVVEAGTNLAEYGRTHGGLDAKSPIFLKNGYIVVNFNLESIREGNLAAPHLQYIHAPLMNQWLLEGFQRQVQDSYNHTFSLRDGDVVFYHADRSSRDDFSAQVPH
ncbi:bacterial surface protein, partial [Paenibacillus silvae]